MINGDGGCSFWQYVQADSQPKSSGLVLGRRPLGAILHSSNEPGELSQWLCHYDSTINIILDIIIIIIIIITTKWAWQQYFDCGNGARYLHGICPVSGICLSANFKLQYFCNG